MKSQLCILVFLFASVHCDNYEWCANVSDSQVNLEGRAISVEGDGENFINLNFLIPATFRGVICDTNLSNLVQSDISPVTRPVPADNPLWCAWPDLLNGEIDGPIRQKHERHSYGSVDSCIVQESIACTTSPNRISFVAAGVGEALFESWQEGWLAIGNPDVCNLTEQYFYYNDLPVATQIKNSTSCSFALGNICYIQEAVSYELMSVAADEMPDVICMVGTDLDFGQFYLAFGADSDLVAQSSCLGGFSTLSCQTADRYAC